MLGTCHGLCFDKVLLAFLSVFCAVQSFYLLHTGLCDWKGSVLPLSFRVKSLVRQMLTGELGVGQQTDRLTNYAEVLGKTVRADTETRPKHEVSVKVGKGQRPNPSQVY